MKVLITGNNGYVGTVLTDKLIKRGYFITGFDVNYFKSCTLEPLSQNQQSCLAAWSDTYNK